MYKKFSGVEFEVPYVTEDGSECTVYSRLIFKESSADLYIMPIVQSEDEYEDEDECEKWTWVCGLPYYQPAFGKFYNESELVEDATLYIENNYIVEYVLEEYM